jgi:hypothetical protein
MPQFRLQFGKKRLERQGPRYTLNGIQTHPRALSRKVDTGFLEESAKKQKG